MNKDRREELSDVIDFLADAKDRLECIRMDEEDSMYNLPEGLQFSATGDAMQDAIDTMDEISSKIDEVIDCINKLQNPPKKSKK